MNITTKLPGTKLQPGDGGVAVVLKGIPLLPWLWFLMGGKSL